MAISLAPAARAASGESLEAVPFGFRTPDGDGAVLAGLRASAPNDDKLLTEAARVFDGLYKNFSKENRDD